MAAHQNDILPPLQLALNCEPDWFRERIGLAYSDQLWPALMRNAPDIASTMLAPHFTPAHLTCAHVSAIKVAFPHAAETLEEHLLSIRRSLVDEKGILTRDIVRFPPLGQVRCYKSSMEPGDYVTMMTPKRDVLYPQPRWFAGRRPGLSCTLSGELNSAMIGLPPYDLTEKNEYSEREVLVLCAGSQIPSGIVIEQDGDEDDCVTVSLSAPSKTFYHIETDKWTIQNFDQFNLDWEPFRALVPYAERLWPDWFSSGGGGGDLVCALSHIQKTADDTDNLFYRVHELLGAALSAQTPSDRIFVVKKAEILTEEERDREREHSQVIVRHVLKNEH
jgi:hypothetical protein